MKAPLVLKRSKSKTLKTSFQQKPPRLVRWGFHPSPANNLMIGITPDGSLCRVAFANGRKVAAILKEWQKGWRGTEFVEDKAATAKLAQMFFAKSGDVKLLMIGTLFQQAVWKELAKIPVGRVISYAEVARRIKRPKAVRAVGTACGANPIPLLVPCHRVIATSGGLGGFGGGLSLKRELLLAEGVSDVAA